MRMKAKLELVDAPTVQKLSICYRRDDGVPRYVSVTMQKDTGAMVKALSALIDWLVANG